MCSKPDPAESYRDLSRLVESLREGAAECITLSSKTTDRGDTISSVKWVYPDPTPAHQYGWAGVRTYYGLLECA